MQTPHDASIKALILDIYLQIDSLVGTSYQKDALSRRLSIDVLVSQLNQIVRVNHIGLLVIDELQNIAYRKSDGGMQLKKLPAEPVPDCLLALDLLLQDTLDSNFDYRDGSVYHAVLDSALRSRGWRSLTGGRTYATKIETALLNLYGSYIPTADLSTKQLHATLCSKSVALRYVLQLAVLLGLSLHDLLHAPDAVPDYKAEMKAMYQSGASMYHIAQLYGIDAKTVARWIKS